MTVCGRVYGTSLNFLNWKILECEHVVYILYIPGFHVTGAF